MNQILEELQPLYSGRALQEKPDIWIVRGEFNIIAKIKEYINESKRELMIAASILSKPLLDFLSIDMNRFKNIGVKSKILVTEETDPESLRELSRFGEVKVETQMFGNGIIVDGKRVMLFTWQRQRFGVSCNLLRPHWFS